MKENIILRTAEGREFILAEINDFDREIELSRQNQELMAFLEQRGRETEVGFVEELDQSFASWEQCHCLF